MPKILLVLIAVAFAAGCKKDTCSLDVPAGACVSYYDTAQAYQLLMGKWYLCKVSDGTLPLNTETSDHCFTDHSNYLEFLPNRTINMGGYPYAQPRTMPCQLNFRDSANWSVMYNQTMLLDTAGYRSSVWEEIMVCHDAITISSTHGSAAKWVFYARQ